MSITEDKGWGAYADFRVELLCELDKFARSGIGTPYLRLNEELFPASHIDSGFEPNNATECRVPCEKLICGISGSTDSEHRHMIAVMAESISDKLSLWRMLRTRDDENEELRAGLIAQREKSTDWERELILCMRLGNEREAKRLMNHRLLQIFVHTGGRMDLIKARATELLAGITRAAVEAGAPTDQLLFISGGFSNELNRLKDFEDICRAIVEALDSLAAAIHDDPTLIHSRGLRAAVDYIGEHYREQLTLASVAKAVYLNPYYLSHLFTQELGVGFVTFLTNLRIERARLMLTGTDRSVAEIAREFGYDDCGYFARVFRKHVGCTPLQYRKKNSV